MKKLLVVAALAALVASPAMADIPAVESEQVFGFSGGAPGAMPRGTVVYSNITDGPTAAYSRAYPPAAEIGDDLLMTGGGPLDSVGFSVYNSSSSAGILQTADLTLKFYNWDESTTTYVLAGGLFYDDVDFGEGGLAAGYYTTFALTGLYDEMNPINLTNDILATLTIDDLTGGSNRVGQVLMNPPTIGTSGDVFYRDGSWYWFSGSPVANFYWEIDVIPEPGTLALLGLGLLGLIRRR